jgi:hypothetical protein
MKASLLQSATADEGAPAAPVQRLLWVLLPMGAAMQLSAVTSYLTANIAAIPLLWILPLGVYLLTIIIAFEFPHLLPRSIVARFLILMLAGLGYALSKQDVEWPLRISIGFFLMEAFASCLFCHSEAYRLRPRRRSESTLFYLLFAAGGALGAFVIGIVFPLAFRFNFDLVITCCFTALLAFLVTWEDAMGCRHNCDGCSDLLDQHCEPAKHDRRGAELLRCSQGEAEGGCSRNHPTHADQRQRRARNPNLRHR